MAPVGRLGTISQHVYRITYHSLGTLWVWMYQEGVAGVGVVGPSWYVFQICVCDFHSPTARAPARGAATRRRIYRSIRSFGGGIPHPDVPRKGGGGDSGHYPIGWVGGARRAPHVHPVCCAKGAVSPGCTDAPRR